MNHENSIISSETPKSILTVDSLFENTHVLKSSDNHQLNFQTIAFVICGSLGFCVRFGK